MVKNTYKFLIANELEPKSTKGFSFFLLGRFFFICSQYALIKFSTCFSNSQCVPQHTPNNTSFYRISSVLSFTLVTYIISPKKKLQYIYFETIIVISYNQGYAPFFWKTNDYCKSNSTSIFDKHPPQHIP